MAYIFPNDNPLLVQLLSIDTQRDTLRAQLSDEALYRTIADARTDEARVYAEENWKNRMNRRKMEKRICGYYTPPGPWDSDLDRYNEDEYIFELDDGYKGKLKRNGYLSWNGYVILPKGHPYANKHYLFFNYEAPKGFPLPDVELTFSEEGIFGFDHAHGHDVHPAPHKSVHKYSDYNNYNYASDGTGYLTFNAVKNEVIELAKYFHSLTKRKRTWAEVVTV
jgi:hypothetical protein